MTQNNEFLWKILETVNERLNHADSKAATIIAAIGVLIGMMVTNLDKIIPFIKVDDSRIFLGCLVLLSLLVSSYYSLRCVLPRLRVGEPRSIIYFQHIAKHSVVDYAQSLQEVLLDSTKQEDQITHQIWANAYVVSKKFRDIYISVWGLIGASFFSIVLVVIFVMRAM